MTTKETHVGLARFENIGATISPYESLEAIGSMLREAMRSGGLGQKDENAPLVDIIAPGMTVLMKPNWVLHANQGGYGMDCLVTHPEFLAAVLKEVVKAKPGRIIIADAPVQSCVFDLLIDKSLRDRLQQIAAPIPCDIIDLRNVICPMPGTFVKNPLRDPGSYILFDLGSSSILEPISKPEGHFRITNYDPAALSRNHGTGRHQYVLAREPFEADVILNLPKLKTHRKAGITAALKNIVGVIGDKDCLPHHRIGGSGIGGDCYEGKRNLKRMAEICLDRANRHLNRFRYYPWALSSYSLLMLNQVLYGERQVDGGWHGNDTVWRMALDLNQILVHGRVDGSLTTQPQRTIYSICDGITAGEGCGPLASEPVKLGIITFASSSAYADLAHTALMHFDWRQIPLVSQAFERHPYNLVGGSATDLRVCHRGNELTLEEVITQFGMPFKAPDGWEGFLELAPTRGHTHDLGKRKHHVISMDLEN